LLKHSNTAPCFNSLPFQGRAGEGVLGDMGYTKHYGVYAERSRSAGSERVCSKLGGGLLLAPVMPTEATVEAIFEDYEQMRNRLFDLINKFANCNPHPEQQTVTYIDIEPYLGGIQDYLDRHEPEENRFFYHPDHLGSSNFITDAAGDGYQHLQYLPFGETAVSQKLSWWSTPYQFTGKEKDDETGYNYFGARYYKSDLSIWLSVDPLAGMYVSISPYAYCLNNPTNFSDPDGRWVKGAGFFRNLVYSDQRNLARMEANRHPGGVYGRDIDGVWRAYWPFEDNNFVDEGIGADKLRGFAFKNFYKTSQMNASEGVAYSGGNIFLKTWSHYQIGGRKDLNVSTSSLDFSFVSKKDLVYDSKNDTYSVNLFSLNKLSQTSLALGKVSLKSIGNDMYTINRDFYDFNIEWKQGLSTRNVATFAAGLIHGPVIDNIPVPLPVFPFFGPSVYTGSGSYWINFNGSVYVKP
jgi:RHS repeat-associated protein